MYSQDQPFEASTIHQCILPQYRASKKSNDLYGLCVATTFFLAEWATEELPTLSCTFGISYQCSLLFTETNSWTHDCVPNMGKIWASETRRAGSCSLVWYYDPPRASQVCSHEMDQVTSQSDFFFKTLVTLWTSPVLNMKPWSLIDLAILWILLTVSKYKKKNDLKQQ